MGERKQMKRIRWTRRELDEMREMNYCVSVRVRITVKELEYTVIRLD